MKKYLIVALLVAAPVYAQEAPSGDGSTPLHWAAYRDDLAKTDQLLRGGANVNAANDLGVTPLWAASINGSDALVKRLLEAGANPNAALVSGETPLMVASRPGSGAVARCSRSGRIRMPRCARSDGADVGGLAEACRCHQAAAGRQGRCACEE